ncbi:hypothetical protein GHK92_03225 [Nocardioides sp. dk4132]|uniref:hypothetical protein n=1 Tax=unclassified Nocardioides TaxID=2615069 RepID=UPI001294AF6D|nr:MULTISPECIES: hypothetical protein [unclassified Nocardioides]MQW74873.1 hypothetical protein [Nocardioides sp. dk4132]QGA06758.1 hypothetical protein GFH29_04665 [Nocardioides sp. dk884]
MLSLALGAGALAGCGDDEASPTDARATGVPAHYADAIAEGLERYPEIGRTGMGDFQWDCPLETEIEVDGEEHDDVLHTTFFGPMEEVHLVECSFHEPFSVSLAYAEAESDEAFTALESATGAVEQSGNEQTEETITVGERDFVVVHTDFPTNPAADFNLTAHHLDPETRSRTTLEVSGSSDGLSEEYDERAVAEDLAAILSAG